MVLVVMIIVLVIIMVLEIIMVFMVVMTVGMMLTKYLINKEPCGEEEADAHKYEGEVGEDGGVDGGDVAGEGVQGGQGHLDGLQGRGSSSETSSL